MKRRHLLPRLALGAIVLVAAPAAADAPIDQYEQFDRDTREITDHQTTLVWQRVLAGTPTTLTMAEIACGAFGGRIPTVKELLTLVDEEPHQEYQSSTLVTKMIDAQAFPGTKVDLPYWTSTPAVTAATDDYWTVSFADGVTRPKGKTDTAYVRCVK